MDAPQLVGIVTTIAGLLLASPASQAQTSPTTTPKASPGAAPRIARIGALSIGSPGAVASPRLEALRAGLRELGYVEGQSFVLEERYGENSPEKLSAGAAELVRDRVDLIVAGGDAAVRAARRATTSLPIVVALTGDLVESGHAASLARPGGNVTGLVDMSPALSAKRLELLREVLPGMFSVAVLWNPANAVKVLDYKMTRTAAQALGVRLQSLEVRGADDLATAVNAARRERAGALLILAESLTNTYRVRIADLANKAGLPTMCYTREWAEGGCLMGYGPNEAGMYRRAATYVDKILKGARPGDLPIEQPTEIELVINRKTARALGLSLPPGVLGRATAVVE